MPDNNEDWGASNILSGFTPSLPQGAYPTAGTAVPRKPIMGSDMSQMFNFMAQQGQQQQQLQNNALFGRHLGMDGTNYNPTPGNPTSSAADPWGAGGLFHGGFAANMDPAALRASQGGTAMNQWADPMHGGGSAPDPRTNAQAAMAAEPQQHQNPFSNPAPLTGPPASDSANLHQNMALAAPGGFNPHNISALSGTTQAAPAVGGISPTSKNGREAASMTARATRSVNPQTGASFGMFGSPRPGFAF